MGRRTGGAAILDSMEIKRFLAELESRLAEARGADEREYERFFAELAPRLKTAKQLDAELDRHLARRFNVFDYLRTDELGLSRVIADLLDPRATHGQGELILETLLERIDHDPGRLGSLQEWLPPSIPGLETSRVSVTTERTIPADRRIDVVVEFAGADGRTGCLAIENKPYAGDQANQVRDYLVYLEEKYPERFLLLYVSPDGEGPSKQSVDLRDLEEKRRGRFGIVPYDVGDESRSDEYDDYRFPFSLSDWFAECRRRCEVDRLRWFLRDAEAFCRLTFGVQTMTTDSESKAIRDFLLEGRNPNNLRTALVVYESWPAIRSEVCERFLKRLCSLIEQKTKEEMKYIANDLDIGCVYGGEKRHLNLLWLSRKSWTDCGNEYYGIRRIAVLMQANLKDADGWWIGIVDPGDFHGDELVQLLGDEKFISGGPAEPLIPWWDWMDEGKRNWSSLVPSLQEECGKEGGGEITAHYVARFLEVATMAIPIIDEVEANMP